jgi:hypothetical protein
MLLHGVQAQDYVCIPLQVAVTKSKASRQSKMPKLSGNGSVSSSADGCGGGGTSILAYLPTYSYVVFTALKQEAGSKYSRVTFLSCM